ncbi:MAG: WYL domain-containing protein [Lunatimonas sp.]|uniref:helix-turn-helix transcriptional regulator n=1 Tax=Lunatimonas sp. TaxID=2060141 RepID=UPI00263B0729|nr:WYL domain-containing protein [Lunatimonas sp.]MCC5937506.1 WYL domain-containing protein [Lunatimonas sp.]
MPKNRFAEVRYRVLDRCLRDRTRKYTVYDLAEECTKAIFEIDEIDRPTLSTKQIKNDLMFLESEAGYRAPIMHEKLPGETKHFYQYEDPGFSISQRPLTDQDVTQLRQSLAILRRFKGMHFDGWIEDFSGRIAQLHDIPDIRHVDSHPIIRFEHEDYFTGADWIERLYKAIETKEPLQLTYQQFGQNPVEHHVSPYLLKQYNRRWFLLGKTRRSPTCTTFPLDRIKQVDRSKYPYEPYPGDQPEEFFEDIVGVINDPDQEPMEILLEVDPSRFPYLNSKPIHDSQKRLSVDADTPGWHRIRFLLKPNYEFYAILLSHGDKVKVISPEKVRKKLKEIINKMASNYE